VLSSHQIDFSSLRFSGRELKLPTSLTIFGRDLPELEAWAYQNGVAEVRHVADTGQYLENDHEIVAHEFERLLSLEGIEEARPHIERLLGKTKRLILLINIVERCTIYDLQRVLRQKLPDLTFRIVHPRAGYVASGMKVIVVERRRPRVFLFVGGMSSAGKTESAIWLGSSADVTVVHGDEYFFGVLTGEIAAPPDLRNRIGTIQSMPFDRSLFAQFVALMPAFNGERDVALDFLLPALAHASVMEFFKELGFFPTLCLTSADLEHYSNNHYANEARFYKQELEGYKNAISRSSSWRLTAPLRLAGRPVHSLAKSGKLFFHRIGRSLSPAADPPSLS
jgi:hypothetical protein